MKYDFNVLHYDPATEEFSSCVVLGYEQIIEADSYEGAETDYINWLHVQDYFDDMEIPEERIREAVAGKLQEEA